MALKLITISIPVYNELGNIPELIKRLTSFTKQYDGKYNFEFLFTDNASTDGSFELLNEYGEKDDRVRVIRMARNFGYQKSILTNYLNARGDAIVQFDSDLQDPVELISGFISEWEAGHKVVFGRRVKRDGDAMYGFMRKIYYRLLNKMTEFHSPNDAGDFRLIDREVVQELAKFKDQSPYLRGMISYLGYNQVGLDYERSARFAGKSKFSFFKMADLAMDGFCSQTTAPLKIVMWGGLFMTFLSILLGFVFLFLFFGTSVGNEIPGYTSIICIVLFSLGIQSFFLGIIGQYLGRIASNVREAPFAVYEETNAK